LNRSRDPFTQALDSLRLRLEEGVYAPGRPLVIVREAQRLALSTTPVREAVAWLAGEGLIERAPSGGFLVPRLDVETVRDRWRFRLVCLELAIECPWLSTETTPATGCVDLLPRRLARLVQGAGSPALYRAFDYVSAQLRQSVQAERALFDDLEVEAASILETIGAGDGGTLREVLGHYHRRRIDAAPLLILQAELEGAGRETA
jgi:DNA-binding transcriptional MocR family regulator